MKGPSCVLNFGFFSCSRWFSRASLCAARPGNLPIILARNAPVTGGIDKTMNAGLSPEP